jgi:hypothetical protein
MKILINSVNAAKYCSVLEKSLDKFIEYCKSYPGSLRYTAYMSMALWVKEHYKDSIALHILNFADAQNFLTSEDAIFPSKTLEFLYSIGNYVFDEVRALSLEEQNMKSREYVHFDFSVKRIKTINDLLNNTK